MFSIMSREALLCSLRTAGITDLKVDTSVLDVTSPHPDCIYLDVLGDVRNENYRFEDFISACEQMTAKGKPCEFERVRGLAFAIFAEANTDACRSVA